MTQSPHRLQTIERLRRIGWLLTLFGLSYGLLGWYAQLYPHRVSALSRLILYDDPTGTIAMAALFLVLGLFSLGSVWQKRMSP